MQSFQELLGRVSAGEDLTQQQMTETLNHMMTGQVSDQQIGLMLMALRAKGETVAEVAGAAQAMRQHMVCIKTERKNLLDTCGTGGDGSGTFNISTAAALVIAAAGVPIAKHGNRSITSKSGSADALRELGVNVEASVDQVERCLDELGICFCFAPLMHPAMKSVAAVRKKLGVPTIFNVLGPLSNPARAEFQLLGVGRSQLRPLMANALARLGVKRAMVVCGEDGLDEVTLNDQTQVTQVDGDRLEEWTWTPEDFGLEKQSLETIRVDGPEASAGVIRGVLEGKQGPARDIVLLNAAVGLLTAGQADSPTAAMAKVSEAVDRGAADDLLKRLAELSHRMMS